MLQDPPVFAQGVQETRVDPDQPSIEEPAPVIRFAAQHLHPLGGQVDHVEPAQKLVQFDRGPTEQQGSSRRGRGTSPRVCLPSRPSTVPERRSGPPSQ